MPRFALRLLTASLVTALAAANVLAGTPQVAATIDLADDASTATKAEALMGALTTAGPAVRLDLTIAPRMDGDTADYGTTAEDRSGKAVPLRCADGPGRLPSGRGRLHIQFSPAYNHLLLSVAQDDDLAAPFSTIACEYRAGSEHPALIVRGYFAVSQVAIPQAVDMHLRPVSPLVSP